MYHPVKVAKISNNQRSKLVKGQPVRIKPGNQTTIHLSAPQIKKMAKAHQLGKGITVQFDPYQAEQHGCGFFGSLYDKAKALYDKGKAFYEKNKDNALMKAGVQHLRKQAHQRINEYADQAKENEYNPQLIKQLSNYAHQKVQGKGIFGSVGSFIGNKIASKIPIIGDVAGPLISKGTNYLGEQVDKKLGTGRKKKVKHTINPMLMKRKGGALKPAGL